MNDAINILKNYVQAIETTKSSQIIVANVRSFVPEALDKCCREAENIRSKMNTALWSDLEELFLIYDWTNGGLPSNPRKFEERAGPNTISYFSARRWTSGWEDYEQKLKEYKTR